MILEVFLNFPKWQHPLSSNVIKEQFGHTFYPHSYQKSWSVSILSYNGQAIVKCAIVRTFYHFSSLKYQVQPFSPISALFIHFSSLKYHTNIDIHAISYPGLVTCVFPSFGEGWSKENIWSFKLLPLSYPF